MSPKTARLVMELVRRERRIGYIEGAIAENARVVRAIQAERLVGDSGDPTDEAYNRAIDDVLMAVDETTTMLDPEEQERSQRAYDEAVDLLPGEEGA